MKNAVNIEKIIKERRSIYPQMYTSNQIADSTILEILELAKYAPTHRLTQPWKFKVFTGDGLKRLAEYLSKHYRDNTPAELYSEKKYLKTLSKPKKSSHVIAICMTRDMEERIPEWEEIASVAMAVQNIWLSMTQRGIGTYWSTPKSMLKGSDFLDLKKGERCLGIMYVGIPETIPPMPPREDMAAKIEWIDF